MAPRQFESNSGQQQQQNSNSSSSSSSSSSTRNRSRCQKSVSNLESGIDDTNNNDYNNNNDNCTRRNNQNEQLAQKVQSSLLLPLTTSLPLLNGLDMFAVALVVPLLPQYYMNAGVTSATQRELLSSVFSFSQILGGILLSGLMDAQILQRKTVLFLSFGGSAMAYAMILYGQFQTLVASRILVGLVKQTMTITSSIMTQCTTNDTRAKYMGRLASSSTGAWIAGPSVGALLYKYVSHTAPALLACCIFIINIVLAAILIPDTSHYDIERNNDSKPRHNKKTLSSQKSSLVQNLQSCFSSKALGSIILSMLLLQWVTRATSYSTMGSYYEEMYGLEPHHRGYIQSYQKVLGFVVQSSLVEIILNFVGGERSAGCLSVLLLGIATLLETQQSFSLFLAIICPTISLSNAMVHVSLQTLLTQVAPTDSIASVFAALDVLQSASAVTVPFYRTTLFALLGGGGSSAMAGDPDPITWVISCTIHWFVATLIMSYLLLPTGQTIWSLLMSKLLLFDDDDNNRNHRRHRRRQTHHYNNGGSSSGRSSLEAKIF